MNSSKSLQFFLFYICFVVQPAQDKNWSQTSPTERSDDFNPVLIKYKRYNRRNEIKTNTDDIEEIRASRFKIWDAKAFIAKSRFDIPDNYEIRASILEIRDTSYEIRDTRYGIWDLWYDVRYSRYEIHIRVTTIIRDTRFDIRDSRFMTHGSRFEIRDSGHKIRDPRHQI